MTRPSGRRYSNGMVIIRIKKPIDPAFDQWIHAHPESYHQLDMERFYRFVKTVAIYSRSKDSRTVSWLRKQIKATAHHLDEDDIEYYCDLFVKLQEFHRTAPVLLRRVRTY